MVDFSNIAKQAKPQETRLYIFDSLVGEPSLVCRPAHDENAAFFDERIRLAAERAEKVKNEPRRKSGDPIVTPDIIRKSIEEDRDYDRRIIAKVCIADWGPSPPVDAKGKPVPFTEDNARAFLEALPNYIIDPFRNWIANIFNFVDRPKADPGQQAALGESLPST